MKRNKKGLLIYSAKPATRENMGAATYTCTMHPEVNSGKPGKCPKCGMELVKKN